MLVTWRNHLRNFTPDLVITLISPCIPLKLHSGWLKSGGCEFLFLLPPANEVWGGGNVFTGVCLSIREERGGVSGHWVSRIVECPLDMGPGFPTPWHGTWIPYPLDLGPGYPAPCPDKGPGYPQTWDLDTYPSSLLLLTSSAYNWRLVLTYKFTPPQQCWQLVVATKTHVWQMGGMHPTGMMSFLSQVIL